MFTHFHAITKSELDAAIIRNPIVVSPVTTVMAAICKMSELRSQCATMQDQPHKQAQLHIDVRSSCVLVVEQERILGIMTERDVVRLSAEQRSLDVLTVQEVMTHPVVTMRESAFTDLFMTVNLIQQQHIRHLPIVDDQDRLVGIVTHESLRQTSRPIDLLRLRLVSEVMTSDVVCAQAEQPMLAITKLMATHCVSSVIITTQNDHAQTQPTSQVPIGIVTERDIVQFQALGLNLDRSTASEMMSSPIFTVKPTDSLLVVYQLMEQHFISRLAVTDPDNQLLGIITQSSLLQALNPVEIYNLAAELEQRVLRLEEEKIALLEHRNIELEQQQILTYRQLQEELQERQKTELALLELNQSLEAKIAKRTQELRTSNAKVRAMIDALPDLLLRVNRQGECLEYINTGEYRDKFHQIHENISEILPPDLYQRQLEAIDQALITGNLQVYEHQLYDKHDRLVFEEVRIVPIGCDEAMIILRDQTDSKRTELALKASEARFRGIFDANVVGMLFVNLNGEITDANDCFLNLVGYSRDELQLGQLDWARMTAPEYLSMDMHAIAHVKLNGVIEPWEKVYFHKDGYPVSVLSSLAMVSETECVCVVVDISDLKRTEKELQQKLATIETAIDGIAIKKADQYIYLNRSHAKMFGYAEVDELLSKSWHISYSPAQLERFEYEIFPALQRDRSWAGEMIAIRKDGSTFDEELSLSLTDDGLLICVCRDISDRKHSEQIIAQQAQQEILLREITQRIRTSLNLQTIFDTACQEIRHLLNADRVGIFRFNIDSGCDDGEFVAEAAIAGLRSVLAQPVHDHCFGEDYSPLYLEGRFSAMDDIYNHGLKPCHLEVLTQFQIRANLIIPLFYGEKLWGLLCVHQCDRPRTWQRFEINLTQQIAIQLAIAIQQASLYEQLQQELGDRKKAQQQLTERNEQLAISNEELARATRLKDEFLANMSHELRTPLNAILGMTEGLQEGIFGHVTEPQIKALQTVERSGSHLLDLINDILDVAKIESGQLELEYSNVEIEPLCQSSLAFIKQQALKRRIQLHTQFPNNLPELSIDERRIRQALINLLSNAVKFTPEEGTISLEVTLLPVDIADNLDKTDIQGYVRIAIKDTGIGISHENISKLFQPFFQIDSALNRQYQGTGLGLPLVKRIVEMHGGRVNVASELGVGSCFMIDIPHFTPTSAALTPHQNITATVNSQADPQNSRTFIILLVEDSEANIITLSSYLIAKGYEIILAHNGQEALNILRSLQPDLILMDIQMPIMDGLEATQKIRQLPAFASTPIIALTALAMPNDVDLCLAAGATGYLSKPVKLRELARTIQKLLI